MSGWLMVTHHSATVKAFGVADEERVRRISTPKATPRSASFATIKIQADERQA